MNSLVGVANKDIRAVEAYIGDVTALLDARPETLEEIGSAKDASAALVERSAEVCPSRALALCVG